MQVPLGGVPQLQIPQVQQEEEGKEKDEKEKQQQQLSRHTPTVNTKWHGPGPEYPPVFLPHLILV